MQSFKSLFIISLILLLVSCSKDSYGTSEVNPGSNSSYSGYGNTQTAAATQYTLTVTAGTGGSVSTSGGTYDDGTIVTVTATPNDGYEFVGWNGSDSTNATIDITINSNTTLEALFSEIQSTAATTQYNLTVTAGTGGSVSTSGGTYDDGTTVTITATPDDGYEFVGWNGSDSSNATIDITINSDTTLEAVFSEIQSTAATTQYNLTVTAGTGGSVSTSGGTYDDGTTVTITATPDDGYEFVGWNGSDSSNATIDITINSDTTLEAVFSEIQSTSSNIWSGPIVQFSKENGSNPSLESNQDRITSNVWITRGNNGGQIFNIVKENSASKSFSPRGTLWAKGNLDNIDNLTFEPFRTAVGQPKAVVGIDLVLYLVDDDIYLSVKFTSWSQGRKGGFAYERSSE